MNKLPLTIVTAVLNEERILPDFLKHVTSIADEVIVVVDYRNTDKSIEIATDHGCKVLVDKGQSEGIVFNNKNWGIEQAKNDWVMIVDADERLDETLQKEVIKIVNGETSSKANIFQTSFVNFEFGKLFEKSDQKQKPFVRLFRKGSFIYQTGKTAEGFGIQTNSLADQNSLGKVMLRIPLLRTWYIKQNKNIATLKGHLIHFSHPTISEFIRKIDHYSTREAKILFGNNPKISGFTIVCRLLTEPVKEYLYKLYIWKLYKEGTHGFIASVIYGFYRFLINAKLYHLVYKEKHLKDINKLGEKYHFQEL